MYGAMWSEHCSYKSSKIHLRTLPTEGPAVLVGPGQDAGAVDIGDGLAAVFKMESHSHPSAIEPYQGAATGVGGIVRDIISMGARPVALLDPLMFGPLDRGAEPMAAGGRGRRHRRLRQLHRRPHRGRRDPFAEPHSAEPDRRRDVRGARAGRRAGDLHVAEAHAGSLMVLYGATTGRDGIGGVSVLASATLDESSQDRRPSVQIGDPFAEKLLIEASLELIDQGLLEGLQDLGGAGITCAVSESAARAGMGAVLDLDAVPLREPGMEAFEILTSESQERMLAIVHPSQARGRQRGVRAMGPAHRGDRRARRGRPPHRDARRRDRRRGAGAPRSTDEGPEYDRPHATPDCDRGRGRSHVRAVREATCARRSSRC